MSLPNIDLKGNPFYLNDEEIAWVDKTLSSMTEDEKIQQLFFPALFDFSKDFIDSTLEVLEPSGFMYRPCDIETAIETGKYLRSKFKVPPLIAANLEKGGNGIVKEGTMIGSPMAIAATGKEENAHRWGEACAVEAKAVGANWAFAPIIDIDYNFRSPITNTRTLGNDPEVVKNYGKAYVEECQKVGLAACIKHFPGDGRDERDQHLVTTINDMDCEEWMDTYGAAYKASIEAGALTVMVGHIMQPAWQKRINPSLKDNEIMPGTLSPELIGKDGLLRGILGFNGLIATDATTMNGMLIAMDRKTAVPYSIASGADIFLFNRNLQEDVDNMRAGVRDGIITKERLDEAVTRILALKAAVKLYKEEAAPSVEEAAKIVGCDKHVQWAHEVADQAITLVKEEPGVLPLDPKKNRVLLCTLEQDPGFQAKQIATMGKVGDMLQELLEKEGFTVSQYEPAPLFEGQTPRCDSYSNDYDYIIYLANYSTKSNQTVVRIEWAQPVGGNVPAYITSVPTIFISVENPYHLIDVPRVRTYINTYGAGPVSIYELVEKLMGRSEFKGKSPVDAFCGKWDTHLM